MANDQPPDENPITPLPRFRHGPYAPQEGYGWIRGHYRHDQHGRVRKVLGHWRWLPGRRNGP
jgi:hypothetical protein